MSVKRRALERHLRKHGAHLHRRGASHDVWKGPAGQPSTVPRHSEVQNNTARAICDQLGVPRI